MLYIFMGQSCTGKSTVADKVKEITNAEIFTGKDYLRLAKSESEACKLFYEKLSNVAENKDSVSEIIIYLITEKSQLDRIMDIKGAYKVKFTATLDTVKSRFAQRMHGKLPPAVEKMIDKQYEEWMNIEGDINVDTTIDGTEKIVDLIISYRKR